ncbi:DUF6932 family protein [Parasphingorhabdus sp.]|uniref:DUF6932 family protein n=1 Tax=Parasphingorhabdus sp. TaxID=2709688 RepID=UPI003BB0880C
MKHDYDQIFSPGRHHLDLSEFKKQIVDNVGGENRKKIWREFEKFYAKLNDLKIDCDLWIDGSFITKKPEPSDIDLSLMIDEKQYDKLSEAALKFLFLLDDADQKYEGFIDAFVCIVYPKGHKQRIVDNPDEWARQWSVEHNDYWLKGFVVMQLES